MAFKKAERKKVPLKIALTGPSGSGKTFTALLIAKGIGGKIAVIDTENESASLYADKKDGPLAGLEFDVDSIDPPYTTDKYLSKMKEAVAAGYNVLIVDSISHQWAGEGGILEKKSAFDLVPKANSFTNWKKVNPEYEKFKSQILHSDIHLICTMRSKQEYQVGTKDGDKFGKVERLGLAPIQRDGMEYEFTLVLDLDVEHRAVITKDRTGMFDGQVFKPTEEVGSKLIEWLSDAKEKIEPWSLKESDMDRLRNLTEKSGLTKEEVKLLAGKQFKDMSEQEFKDLCQKVESKIQIVPNEESQPKPLPWEKWLDDPRSVK